MKMEITFLKRLSKRFSTVKKERGVKALNVLPDNTYYNFFTPVISSLGQNRTAIKSLGNFYSIR